MVGWWQLIVWSLLLTAAFEAITVFFRFGFGWRAERMTRSTVGRMTRGIRIHHGYIGAVVMAAGLLIWPMNTIWEQLWMATGVGLLVSDAVHHFAVLWPIVGHHEFHVVYPEPEELVPEPAE